MLSKPIEHFVYEAISRNCHDGVIVSCEILGNVVCMAVMRSVC